MAPRNREFLRTFLVDAGEKEASGGWSIHDSLMYRGMS